MSPMENQAFISKQVLNELKQIKNATDREQNCF